MSLISLKFAGFLGGIIGIYYLVPMKFRWCILLGASAAFYLLTATPYTAFYLLFSIISVYLGTRYMDRKDDGVHKRTIFLLVLLCNVALLILLKYLGGFWATGSRLLSLFGISLPPYTIALLAPLGMSFYTLQLIGYFTDVYWGIAPAEKNFGKLALFACYFPSISSGPILRYQESAAELFEGHKASYEAITFGLQRMAWGLFKKLVIAERAGMLASPIFSDMDTYNGIWVWIGLAAAVLQIYGDFSGNMDFILGASQCFGVRLPENFRQPFFSLTIQEFWQRWHISLGLWLRDYIMYPLLRSRLWTRFGKYTKKHFGKKAAKQLPTLAAMLVLWLCNGIWHVPYPKYIATVLWFFFAVMAGQLLSPLGERLANFFSIQRDCFSWRLFQRLRTVALYSVGVLFFCTPGVMSALRMGKSAFNFRNIFDLFDQSTFFSSNFLTLCGGKIGWHVLLVSVFLLVGVEIVQNRGGSIRQWLSRQNLIFRWSVFLGLLFTILLFGIYGPGYSASEFIYAGF